MRSIRTSKQQQPFRLIASLLGIALAAFGQSQTGQISGVVIDPTGAAVAGAKVELIHVLTKNTRQFMRRGWRPPVPSAPGSSRRFKSKTRRTEAETTSVCCGFSRGWSIPAREMLRARLEPLR